MERVYRYLPYVAVKWQNQMRPVFVEQFSTSRLFVEITSFQEILISCRKQKLDLYV